jgi:putative acetyltransferase
MPYPDAIEPELVGEYPASAKSGAGYFFDHVLEYRVWCHPECGAPDEFDGEDYYYAFASYEEALAFSTDTEGAEEPLALIRQLEWVNEPEPGIFIHEKGERIAEWRVEWLGRGPRTPGAIELFIQSQAQRHAD